MDVVLQACKILMHNNLYFKLHKIEKKYGSKLIL
jgi:hypothetical protein